MNLAKAFKQQAEDDSRAHVKDFESAVASRQAALAKILEDQVNMLYEALLILQMNFFADPCRSRQKKRLRIAAAEMLFKYNGGQVEQETTTLTPCFAQTIAESLSTSFDRFLAAHQRLNLLASKQGATPPPVTPSQQDEELLQTVLQTQHEKAKQRFHRLLHGDSEGFYATVDSLEVMNGDEIWLSPEAGQPIDRGRVKKRFGETWHSITRSAGKGVRRIVRGFPELQSL